MKILPLFAVLALVLSACGDLGFVTAGPDPFRITPSRPPAINTATPNITYPTTSATLPPPPSLTPSLTFTITPTGPSETPSLTPTATGTFTPLPTSTFTPVPLATTLIGCNTSLDITHSMGEVTNVYATIVNRTGTNLTNVCATLSATDEGRPHPDKSKCIPSLPTGYQVTWKLTVDTTANVPSIMQVAVTSNEGIGSISLSQSCAEIGSFAPSDNTLGIVLPVQ